MKTVHRAAALVTQANGIGHLRGPAPGVQTSAESAALGAERGFVLVSVLAIVFTLTLFAAVMLSVVGKEMALSGLRLNGAQSLYIAEAGAAQGRAALMAYTGIFPTGLTTVDSSLLQTTASNWYANGVPGAQNPFGILDFLAVDGQRLTLNATASTASETFQVNWNLGTPHLKLQVGGAPSNALGGGAYTATVTLTPNRTADPSCAGGPCAIHLTGVNAYEIFYNYTVTSLGTIPPYARREVTYSGSFSIYLKAQSFAQYALFTNNHTDPNGNTVWFMNATTFNGPVYTNGEFAIDQFPKFSNTLQSGSAKAWYGNAGSSVELPKTENVRNGTRIDAPLVPPAPNPQSAPPANFTLGAPVVAYPPNSFNQQGVAIGLSPGNTAQVSNGQIDAAIPELKNTNAVPGGVYVPVVDSNGNCVSDSGEALLGGIYVQGNVDSLTMSLAGSTSNQAVYTLRQGDVTTTVTVNRALNTTTVSMTHANGSSAWSVPSTRGSCPGAAQGPATRTFTGVPKGWQGPGNANGTIIYVNGQITALSGTLQQNEQTTIVAASDIYIQGNVQYQTPPNPSDPTSNPINILGLYSSGGNIYIGLAAPSNVVIQGILMAGSSGSTQSSVVTVQNYNSGAVRGVVNLLGGIVEKYYGAFGTFNPVNGQQVTGYGRNFVYDTRVSRGFAPPYFPGTTSFQVSQGSQALAGVKPAWREATP